MITDFQNDYLIPYDVSDELCVSLTTVYNLLRTGKLPGFKVGRI
ncbi:MAG: helix-turn-helix domain-containing protein [Ruminococcus sp.]|nr:helix-turn-helix domain-containing protein [Ruminococcus sp.]